MSAVANGWNAIRQDAAYGARALLGRPRFTIVAVLTLAIGIGLSTATFSALHTVLLQRFPVSAQERLVVMSVAMRDKHDAHLPLTEDQTRRFARATRTLADVAAFDYHGTYAQLMRDGDRTFNLSEAFVGGRFFDVLGTRPLLGRGLRQEDDVVGAAPVIVLGYGAWRRQFNGDSSVVGRVVSMHRTGEQYRVIGVMPAGLDFPRGADAWIPIGPLLTAPGADTSFAMLDMIARNRSASTTGPTQEFASFLQREPNPLHAQQAPVVTSFVSALVGDVSPRLVAFACAVGLLLLLTCLNVANLLLVRGVSRAPEVALRTAIGASVGRLVTQLVVENMLLAVAGGALGMGVAWCAVHALVAVSPADIPRIDQIGIDWVTAGAALAISCFTVLVFGLAPAMVAARAGVGSLIRSGTRQVTASRSVRTATETLIVAQIALALIVLMGAGLLGRSLMNLEHLDLGVRPSHLLVAELALPPNRFDSAKTFVPLLDRLTARIAALPGVDGAAPAMMRPFAGPGLRGMIEADGQNPASPANKQIRNFEPVTPNYFHVVGTPIVEGRAFDRRDGTGADLVVILSASLARELFPGVEALGKRIRMGGESAPWRTVVGIASDTRYHELRELDPNVYFPLAQVPPLFPLPSYLAIRTTGDVTQLGEQLRQATAQVEPSMALANLQTFDELLAVPLAGPRLDLLLLAMFGFAAATLAGIGLYGALAAMVRSRTRDIAVRRALGATDADTRRDVVRRGMSLAAIGSAIGLVATLLTSRALASLLFGVRPVDALTLVAVTAFIGLVALVSCAVPAYATTRIDPASALRADG